MRWTQRIRHPRTSHGTGSSTALLARDTVAEPDRTALLPAAAEPIAAVPTGAVPETHHATDVPLGCRVVVVGPLGMLRSLSAALPPTWTVDHVDEPGDLTVADLVVLTTPTAGKIASVLARQPEASVIALAHPAARVDSVVDLLAGGATACVRTAEAELVAAHLVACARRYSVGTA